MSQRSLSKSEMEVVRVLWDLGRGTVREVHETLAEKRSIEFGTVQTYLRRLEAKGYVQSTLSGRARVYRARMKPDRVIRETVDEIVQRLLGGRTMPLMRHLIEQSEMSREDIDELRRLVDGIEEADHE